MKQILTSLILLFLGLAAPGQLNDMSVTRMAAVGAAPDAPLNKFSKKPWALIQLEVENGDAHRINGSPITALANTMVTPAAEGDTKYDAYAAGWGTRAAKSVVLHHPDFNNCEVDFSQFLDGPIEGGNIYKIWIRIPESKLLEANKAYNDLDFAKARDLYRAISADPRINDKDKAMVDRYLVDIDSLVAWKQHAEKRIQAAASLEGTKKHGQLLMAKEYYNLIFDKSLTIKSALKAEELKKELNSDRNGIRINPISELNLVSAEMAGNDLRAQGNDAVTYQYVNNKKKSSTGKSALFIIKAPLAGATVGSSLEVKPAEYRNGEYWLYVKSLNGDEEAGLKKNLEDKDAVLFTFKHPDFKAFSFRNKDLQDGSGLQGERVYHVEISTPSQIMTMANNQLAGLELENAYNLYGYNFADDNERQFALKCRRFIEGLSIFPQIQTLEAEAKACSKALRDQLMIKTGRKKFDSEADRKNALLKADATISAKAPILASQYENLYNEGLKNGFDLQEAKENAEKYREYANGVRQIPLVIHFYTMKKLNSAAYGKPEPIETSPTVDITFNNGNANVETDRETVRKGTVFVYLNPSASRMFATGTGKIKISAHDNGVKYEDVVLDMSKLKKDDYDLTHIKVTLISK